MVENALVKMTLVRHGQTEFNAQRRVQGGLDTPLAESGLRQARLLARALRRQHFDALYCSDLMRTRQTMAPYADKTAIAVNYDTGLRERRFGWFEGKTLAEVSQSHPDRAARLSQRDPSYDLHGGESLVNFYQRSVGALQAIASNHRDGDHILVVTHGGVLDCVQRWARGLTLQASRDFDILNTSLNRVRIRGGRCEIEYWADVSHL